MTHVSAFCAALCALLAGGCTAMQSLAVQTSIQSSLAPVQAPQMQAQFANIRAQTTLTPRGQNGETITWVSEDGISLAFQSGVLTSTRGLSDDLMSADISATLAALRGSTRTDYTTFSSYLGEAGETQFRSFVCSLADGHSVSLEMMGQTVQAERFDETCASLTQSHTNSFWIAGDGTMWRSRQWIGDDAGYLVTDLLVK